jgi:hypothetical protein
MEFLNPLRSFYGSKNKAPKALELDFILPHSGVYWPSGHQTVVFQSRVRIPRLPCLQCTVNSFWRIATGEDAGGHTLSGNSEENAKNDQEVHHHLFASTEILRDLSSLWFSIILEKKIYNFLTFFCFPFFAASISLCSRKTMQERGDKNCFPYIRQS